jgi:hypothetical protein
MRNANETGTDVSGPLSTDQAFAAIEEHRQTLKKIGGQEALWFAHIAREPGKHLSDSEALALLAEHKQTVELAATQTALWHSHVDAMFGAPATRAEPMADPAIAAYYATVQPARDLANRQAVRKAREKRAWLLLKEKVTAGQSAAIGIKKEETPSTQPSKASKPINEMRSKTMSNENAEDKAVGASQAANAGQVGQDEPTMDWGARVPNAQELAAAEEARFAKAKQDALADPVKARQTRAGTFALANALIEQWQQARDGSLDQVELEARMMKRLADTAEGMASAPFGAVPGDETMKLVVAEDLKAITAIETPAFRQRALWVAAESRIAQPAYDAEFMSQASQQLVGEMGAAVAARELELATLESVDHTLGKGNADVENTITPAPAIVQQSTAATTEDKTNLKITLATSGLLASLPVDDITDAEAAEYVQEDLVALNGIKDGKTRERALDALTESSRAQPRYMAQLKVQAPEIAAEVETREPGLVAATPAPCRAPENTIEPAPAIILGDTHKQIHHQAEVPEIDAAALDAVAAARAKDREQMAKLRGWNTIERSAVMERKPVIQAAAQPAPVAATPTALAVPEAAPMVVPDEVEKAYLHVGNRFYMPKNHQRVAFEDHGDKLATALNDYPVTLAMVQIAQARGWTSIRVNGTPEFRKEAWRAAALRGITVEGYQPTELDLADLARRTPKAAAGNEVAATARAAAPAAPQANAQTGIFISAEDAALLAVTKAKLAHPQTASASATTTAAAPSPAVSAAPAAPGAPLPPGDKLIAHGAAKYQHNPDNPDSYYAILENNQGKQRTVWGVKLGEAIDKAGVKVGDRISFYKNGEEQVSVDANVTNAEGQVVGKKKIGAIRNEWAVKAHAFVAEPPSQAVQQHPDLAGAYGAATKLGLQAKADGFSPQALAIIEARQRENIGKAIARGELPKADLKEKMESKRGAQQEMMQ